jgi:hypothetical protein
MSLPDRTPPDDFPHAVDESRLIDISDLQRYLRSRAMSDARHESEHRELTWSSLGCSFEVARVFGESVRVSFREGPPSETEISTDNEPKRQALHDYEPTYHLRSNRLHSEIAIRTDVEDPPIFEAPSSTLEAAIYALSSALVTGEPASDVMTRPASVLLEGFGDTGAAAFDYQRSPMHGGRLIQFFHERPITGAIERRMITRLVKAIGDRIEEIENNGGDPSPLQEDLSFLSKKISEAGLSEKTAKVARDLANYVE